MRENELTILSKICQRVETNFISSLNLPFKPYVLGEKLYQVYYNNKAHSVLRVFLDVQPAYRFNTNIELLHTDRILKSLNFLLNIKNICKLKNVICWITTAHNPKSPDPSFKVVKLKELKY